MSKKPKSVLIPTQINDVHALAVSCALRDWGHTAVRWFNGDFPVKQTTSVSLTQNSTKIDSRSSLGAPLGIDRHFDVVWFRRPCAPSDSDNLHDDDRDFVLRENLKFFSSLWWAVAPNAKWINPYDSYRRANSKIAQLMAAREAGFSVPDTLFSNDPLSIREFYSEHLTTGVIYKPHKIAEWTQADGKRIGRAVRLTEAHLKDNASIKFAAGIFQTYVKPKAEYRITAMGRELFSVKVGSSEDYGADWRNAPIQSLLITRTVLPPSVEAACFQVLSNLGIVFGCFDLIESFDGNWYFLEVNEMGQFLWKEASNHDLPLLDFFVRGILRMAGEERVPSEPIRYEKIKSSEHFEAQLAIDRDLHISRRKHITLFDCF